MLYLSFVTLLLCYPVFMTINNDSTFLSGDISENILHEKFKLTKKILVWNEWLSREDYRLGYGQTVFKNHKCTVDSCFITPFRRSLAMDSYDAIIFLGVELNLLEMPQPRKISQRYVYQCVESPTNVRPTGIRDDFFNWTMTYRLDADIPTPYFYVRNTSGDIVAPRTHVEWLNPDYRDENILNYLHINKRKTKRVAWFASNCFTPGNRENIVGNLKKYISIDIFGRCGNLDNCDYNNAMCLENLKAYYFYLSFENSLSVDYVTEKVANALLFDVIPVAYNGANMSKFLPPGSYIDANTLSAKELARLMFRLIKNPREYVKYFWWRKYYTIEKTSWHLCMLCEMLHDPDLKQKSYKIGEWLNATV